MSGKIISLSGARKAKARAEARQRADANAVKHGRTKAEKFRDKAQSEKRARDLDGHLPDRDR
ncbi:hypothetical protein JSE7799_01800 [Jannaschia seosinensis]|uniref:DUF4169 domain-containing protein n=1 Tax=Jannaschia seosinensis TaxID=313367 RepID=A0A0M7B8N9_9RHOB|nr:DUF4169 family protein [Jannaschia seosinensis]CUH39080.1 hypothetical protein JSE7799_01800 [Jannaschia seosinensis]